MENKMKQMRVKFVGAEKENRDQKIPAQKTQSFKEKKPQSWFQRQFQRKMSHDYDSREIEHAAAVAAAAFAVTSQEVSEIPQKKKVHEAPETSWPRTQSKTDGSKSPISQTGGGTRLYSGVGSLKPTEVQGKNIPVTPPTDEKKPEKTITPAPSTKRTATFREHLTNTEDKKPETAETLAPKLPPPVQPGFLKPPPPPPPPPPAPTTTKRQPSRKLSTSKPPPPPPPPPTNTKKQTPTKPVTGETKADVWERAELERIKERYEKLHETITFWENKKKLKARKKLDKQESELEGKRVKALQRFREEMQYIDNIAGGARAQAEGRQRKEELKAKEKANSIRTTGKVPATCLCF